MGATIHQMILYLSEKSLYVFTWFLFHIQKPPTFFIFWRWHFLISYCFDRNGNLKFYSGMEFILLLNILYKKSIQLISIEPRTKNFWIIVSYLKFKPSIKIGWHFISFGTKAFLLMRRKFEWVYHIFTFYLKWKWSTRITKHKVYEKYSPVIETAKWYWYINGTCPLSAMRFWLLNSYKSFRLEWRTFFIKGASKSFNGSVHQKRTRIWGISTHCYLWTDTVLNYKHENDVA